MKSRNRFALLFAAAYFGISLVWIFLSDRLLSNFTDAATITSLSTAKGVFYVVTSTVLIFLALRHMARLHNHPVVPALTALQKTPWGNPWLHCCMAVAMPLTAIATIHSIGHPDKPMLILLMLPITLSALLGGLRPGLVATAVAAIGVNFWFIPPVHSLQISNANDLLSWVFLIANGVIVSVLGNQLGRVKREVETRQQQLEAVVSGTSDAVFIKDVQGRYVMVNRSAANTIGRPADEIIGEKDSALFQPSSAAQIREKDLAIMGAQATQNFSETVTTTDGRVLAFSVTKGPVFDAQGLVIGMFGISRDISQQKKVEAKLIESEERYRSAFASSPDAITITRKSDGTYVDANPSFERIFGWTRESVIGRTSVAIGIWGSEADRQKLIQALAVGHCDNLELALLTSTGNQRVVWVSARIVSLEGEDYIFAVTRDVTAQKQAADALHMAALVYENSSEAMMVTTASGEIVAVNPAFEHITGYQAQEVLGRNPRILSSNRHPPAFYETIWKTLAETGRWQGEIWNRRKNGELYYEHLVINTIRNDDGSIYRHVALFSDITQQKKTEDYIWRQANFDVLTQLPNRRMFLDRAEQETKKATRSGDELALLFIDLDNFKEINDTLGHHVGDALLVEAARRIAECVRETDTCARMGGDEFTILLTGIRQRSDVDRVATAILNTLEKPFALNAESMVISASIGITLYPGDSASVDGLLQNADQAMYVAKKQGKGRFSYFTPDLQVQAMKRLRLIGDLRQAVPLGQLRLHFQPIVELATGDVHKAEALVRWMHPTKGLVGPGEFITVAEESGLIVPIGDWVFREAIQWVQRWRDRCNPNFQISINKSPVQFQKAVATSDWMDYLSERGVPGSAVTIEITEGILMNTDPQVNARLDRYRDLGIEVSIDDFGTGYSSLAYLKKFDIDYLKIDQSFTRNLAPDSSDMALTEAIIVMAHRLGLKVIAEGVETTQQRDLLLAAGCDYGQGYLFSKPVPPEDMELRWLQNQSKHSEMSLHA